MLDSNKVKDMLSTDDIIKLCCDLQEDPNYFYDNQGHPIFLTCLDHHGGDSWKCYYYPETKLFHVYTRGASKDIFEIVQQVKDFTDFRQAFEYVVDYFHLKDDHSEYINTDLTSDWGIFQQITDYSNIEKEEQQQIPVIQENLIEYFYPLAAPEEWIEDHITPEVMYHFGIRIDSALQKIIIPQRNIDGQLIGIRGRSFDPQEILDGKKYMPIFIEGQVFRTPNGRTLFGLYENKDTIHKVKRALIVEGEKSVMQLASYYGIDDCWAVATYGSTLTTDQVQLLLDLDISEIVIGYDREFEGGRGDGDTVDYEKKILKMVEPLLPYVNVSVIMDYNHLTKYKDSPTDCGKEVFEQLFHERMKLNSIG